MMLNKLQHYLAGDRMRFLYFTAVINKLKSRRLDVVRSMNMRQERGLPQLETNLSREVTLA
ncbi:hypothetical protein A8140_08200 [Vibrio campbellii CAIM 519 = NBRC 15631 = ATCC 25920]|nr:hypothetical protein A8140_08200 [Vibrio campbellii CAIM 519 = NBRC 15631 = ATCC 25920]ELU52466.1 hypothetical protein B878_07845 [Vibrio campbellii CAIM 519 = NBRC 15631 = ATCC 25920]